MLVSVICQMVKHVMNQCHTPNPSIRALNIYMIFHLQQNLRDVTYMIADKRGSIVMQTEVTDQILEVFVFQVVTNLEFSCEMDLISYP